MAGWLIPVPPSILKHSTMLISGFRTQSVRRIAADLMTGRLIIVPPSTPSTLNNGVTAGHAGQTNNRRQETLLSHLRIAHTRNLRELDNGLTLPLLVAHNDMLSSESLVCSGKQARPKRVISGFHAFRLTRSQMAGVEPAIEKSLQISGRIRYPLLHQRPA
ncbi:hypothetical protein PoB_003542700 [Plakobranchus ocellatus]|uniref:Uncharacterized protein n=1 Tax=Plakobranchus ocellatus TaxID=259542 RepID=A0AAV4APT5_9GAST|nr:hypothetical protein PoB_003542700 [Plakobranchus ocellatus]